MLTTPIGMTAKEFMRRPEIDYATATQFVGPAAEDLDAKVIELLETEHPLPHRRARGRQQRPARPLYRRYLSQQHEGLRTTTAHQALSLIHI